MAHTPDLIHILRNTLIELEQAEYLDESLLDVKRSLLRSIAEMETWPDYDLKNPSTQL